MQKALVIGGSGFIGSHLVKLLSSKGFKPMVFDIAPLSKHLKAEYVKGNITNYSSLQKAMAGCDTVFHLAALASVPESVENPVLYNGINVSGTLNVLEAARQQNVKRVVFASSCSVYGLQKPPHKESMQPMPLSPYALNKLVGEQYMRMYSQLYSLDTVSLRFFNVFGPGQALKGSYSSVVPAFLESLLGKGQAKIFGSGKQRRDFVFVKDVAGACLLAATAKQKLEGKVFNVGSGKGTSVLELFNALKKTSGSQKKPVFLPSREGDAPNAFADVRSASKALGFKAGYSLEQGLKETVDWFRKEK